MYDGYVWILGACKIPFLFQRTNDLTRCYFSSLHTVVVCDSSVQVKKSKKKLLIQLIPEVRSNILFFHGLEYSLQYNNKNIFLIPYYKRMSFYQKEN